MSEGATLLLVDDEPNILSSLKRVLRDMDLHVITATSGSEALGFLDQHEIALVISDYRMPGMNGVEFLEQVHVQKPETIRVLLSGFADLEVLIEAINTGNVYRYISKPWKEGEIENVVSDCLKQHHLLVEYDLLKQKVESLEAQLREGQKEEDSGSSQEEGGLDTGETYTRGVFNTLKVLCKCVGLMHPKLAAHGERVAVLSMAMGEALDMAAGQLRNLEAAALLHDLGKIQFSGDQLFKKESLLTMEQRQQLKQHAPLGAALIQDVKILDDVYLFILNHHERMDGQGELRRRAAEIPLGARILAVADRFDNLTSGVIVGERALPRAEALSQMQQEVDKNFDSGCLAALSQVLQERKS